MASHSMKANVWNIRAYTPRTAKQEFDLLLGLFPCFLPRPFPRPLSTSTPRPSHTYTHTHTHTHAHTHVGAVTHGDHSSHSDHRSYHVPFHPPTTITSPRQDRAFFGGGETVPEARSRYYCGPLINLFRLGGCASPLALLLFLPAFSLAGGMIKPHLKHRRYASLRCSCSSFL